ncbi:MAG: xanthine dehydrogenase family protein molybdopterin-binding subunit, partial [Chloroflexi bacterium]
MLFPEHGSNIAGHFDSSRENDVLAGADVKIRGRFVNQRLAPVPMEPEAILVVPEGGRLLVRATSQVPFGLRAEMASSLGLSPADIRVV